MQKYNSRKDVPEKYKWDLKSIFSSEEAYKESFAKCEKAIQKLSEYNGKLTDAKTIADFLDEYFKVLQLAYRIYIYAYIINDEELGNSKSIARKTKAEELINNFIISTSFFEPEILKISPKNYEKLFNDNPKLLEYKVSLDDIYRNKKHILSAEKENIITSLNNAMNHFDDASSTMLNSLHDYGYITINGEKEKITSTNYIKFMKNKDKKVRNKVRNSYYKVVGQYAPLSARFLNDYVNNNIVDSNIHNFESSFSRKLFNRKMQKKAYDVLINTVKENTDVLTKYFDLFKKVLNLKKLTLADLNLDLAGANTEYSIEDAMEITMKAVKPLGDDYGKHFKKIFDEHYIDFATYKGKCSGGYSISGYDNITRILLSFNYNLSSVSTIIHECGHCVHHMYLTENNPIWYREKPTIISEVASLTNECLLSEYFVQNSSNKEEKLAGIANILKVFISNLFGAVREGEMELDFYDYAQKGGTLTADYLNDLTKKSLQTYYGKNVELDDYANLSWAPRSHYYMNFYLFDYAFCISVASNVASKIISGDKVMLEKYLNFLKTGGDKTAEETFAVLGFDINDKEVYQNAIKYFESLIIKFNKIYEEGEVNGK